MDRHSNPSHTVVRLTQDAGPVQLTEDSPQAFLERASPAFASQRTSPASWSPGGRLPPVRFLSPVYEPGVPISGTGSSGTIAARTPVLPIATSGQPPNSAHVHDYAASTGRVDRTRMSCSSNYSPQLAVRYATPSPEPAAAEPTNDRRDSSRASDLTKGHQNSARKKNQRG